ncbi:MAG: hypothetical protein Q9160_003084 [Pyrenula sp. 1 TL-2023]
MAVGTEGVGNHASALPLADSPNLKLLPASPTERLNCFKINQVSWGGRLTESQYLQREKHLGGQVLTKDAKLTHWILTDPSLAKQDGGNAILSACESYEKVAYIARGGSVKEVICHGIGSVYCATVYRGRGYAKRMMQELGNTLDSLQPQEEDRFSLLWSDIGKKFYAQVGWKPMPSAHIQLPAIDNATYSRTKKQLALPSTEDIQPADLDELVCKPDCDHVKDVLERESASKEAKGKTLISVRPDHAHMAWHNARENFIAHKLFGKSPSIKGAYIDQEEALKPAIVWTRIFGSLDSESCLLILRLVVPPSRAEARDQLVKSLATLLLRAQLEAQKWDMQQGVQIWNPEDVTLEAAKLLAGPEGNVDVVLREEDSVASLRYAGQDLDNVEWRFSEKYAWC